MKTTPTEPKRRAYRPLIDADYRERDVVGPLRGELRMAYRAVRALLRGLGPQRTYASNRSVMFARRHCFAFVRPRKSFLEICFFADRPIRGSGLKVTKRSRRKHAHTCRVERADQVPGLNAWLTEAYALASPG